MRKWKPSCSKSPTRPPRRPPQRPPRRPGVFRRYPNSFPTLLPVMPHPRLHPVRRHPDQSRRYRRAIRLCGTGHLADRRRPGRSATAAVLDEEIEDEVLVRALCVRGQLTHGSHIPLGVVWGARGAGRRRSEQRPFTRSRAEHQHVRAPESAPASVSTCRTDPRRRGRTRRPPTSRTRSRRSANGRSRQSRSPPHGRRTSIQRGRGR